MRKYLILLISLISFNNLLNAQDLFDEYKINYDRLRKEEKYDSALVVAKQMNFWSLQNETDTSLRYAVSLRYVGNCFNSLNNVDSAKYYFDFSLKTLSSQKRGNSINAIRCFHNIGIIFYNLKDYEKTDSLWSIVLDLNRQLDDKSDDFRDALNNLVALNNDWGRYDQSEKYAFELVCSTKIKYGDRSKQYSSAIGQLGQIYFDNGKVIESEKIHLENLNLRKDLYGPSDPVTAFTIHQLSKIYEFNKEYKKAIEYDSIALQSYKVAYEESNLNVRYLINSIAKLYMKINDYLNAEKYFLNLISIPAQIEEKELYSDNLLDLGILYKEAGEY